MNHNFRNLLAIGMLAMVALSHPRAAQPRQAVPEIKAAVQEYLQAQTGSMPGQIEHSVGAIDARLALPVCATLTVFTPPGARLWGRSSVGVRCANPAWMIYVPVTVQVTGSYLVAARPLPSGQTLTDNDFNAATGDLTQLPAGIVQDPAQALGRTLIGGLAAGQAVRTDMLRAPAVIQQGQNVRLVAKGRGFEVTAEGKALTQGLLGQVVQVRSPSGQTVSGIARTGGIVEINN